MDYDTVNVGVQQNEEVAQWVGDQGADEHCDVVGDDVGQGHYGGDGGDGRGC